MKKSVHYVPAVPGYNIITLMRTRHPDGTLSEYKPFQRPIIAWEITFEKRDRDDEGDEDYAFVFPVTTGGKALDNPPIVYPDGRVEKLDNYCFDSAEQWFAVEKAAAIAVDGLEVTT